MCCRYMRKVGLPQAVARGHVRRPEVSPALGCSMLRPSCGGLNRVLLSRAQEESQSSEECAIFDIIAAL